MRYLIPIILLGFVLVFLWKGLANNPLQITSPLISKSVPSFAALSLENPRQSLTEKIFFGHLSLLIVWSSWCASCIAEQNFLLSLKKNTALNIVGLNYRDNLSAAKLWLKQYGNPYTNVIFDEKGLLAIDLGVYGVPEIFLIDGKGIIHYKHIGPLSEAVWNREVKRLINQYGKAYA
ncbi:MAG: DsbE family thiol:disulfide interchange protein [Pseudomonadota bacterium]